MPVLLPTPAPRIRRARLLTLLAPLACALAPAPRAQVSDVVLCDSRHDFLIRLVDLDGDARYDSVSEISVFYTDGATPGGGTSSPRSVAMRFEGGQPTAYWVDTKTDVVYRGRDLDFDGSLGPFGSTTVAGTEVTLFRDAAALDGSSSPDGVQPTPDGAVWWCTDAGKVRGILRLFDGDGDGDANDPGEQVLMVDGAAPFSVPGAAGPASIDTSALVRLGAAGQGGVVAYAEGDDEAFFRFDDANGDGDVLDPGEAILFLDPTGKNPALGIGPDWADGTLRSLVIPNPSYPQFSSTPAYYARIGLVTSRLEGGVEAFYFASQSPEVGTFATNGQDEGLNGLVFRGVDLNLDGDVNDAGEVRLFYDGSYTTYLPIGFTQLVGIDAGVDGIYLLDLLAGRPTVHRLRDLDGDGDAMEPGEQDVAMIDASLWTKQAALPLGEPYVVDLGVFPAGAWPEPNNLFSVSGTGCSQYGPIPTLWAHGAATIGTTDLVLEVRHAPGGAAALLEVGTSTLATYGIPLPLDVGLVLGLSDLVGCQQYQNFVHAQLATLSGSGPLDGVGQTALDLPADPNLKGIEVFFQWLVLDQANTWGLAFSGLGQTTIQGP